MSEKGQDVASLARGGDDPSIQEKPLSGQGLSEPHRGGPALQSKSVNPEEKSKHFKDQAKARKETLKSHPAGSKANEINIKASATQTEFPDDEIAELRSKLADRDGKIQELEQRLAKLEELIAKQATTIRTQSQTIAKNPAPFKNQQRWIELMREQMNKQTPEASRFSSSSKNPVTSTPTQQPSVSGGDDLASRRSTLQLGTTGHLPAACTSDAVRATAPRGPRAGGASTTGTAALRPGQGPLLDQSVQGSRLSVLPQSGFTGSRRSGIPSTDGPLPSPTIRDRPVLATPPGLGRPLLQRSRGSTQRFSETLLQGPSQQGSASASPLTKIHDAFDGLYRKTEQWAIDFASGQSQAHIAPVMVETVRCCGIADDQALRLLSNPHSKSLLVARLLNGSIQDRCLTPDFLRSIDRDFSNQIERTYARIQGRGPRFSGLHQNVMVNIAELFTSLPHRSDWNDWIKAMVPEVTSQLYKELKTLMSLDVLASPVVEQQALGLLTGIIMEAVELSVLMFSQPFLYRLLFAEIGSKFNPEYMTVVGRQGPATGDSTIQDTVVLGISPLVYADLWENNRLVGYNIRSADVMSSTDLVIE